MKNPDQGPGILGKRFVALGLIAPAGQDVPEDRDDPIFFMARRRGTMMDLIAPSDDEVKDQAPRETAVGERNPRRIGLLGRVLMALGLIVPIEGEARTSTSVGGGSSFESYEAFCSKYDSVEPVMYQAREYAFCQPKSDPATAPHNSGEILRVIRENGKIRTEPIADEIKPKLMEARVIAQINALR